MIALSEPYLPPTLAVDRAPLAHVLVTGKGSSGSWQIRGEQLGRALGASVVPQARDVAGHSVAIVVKRPPPDLLARLRAGHVPWVWDIVDAWPQPHGNEWSERQSMLWLEDQLREHRPAGVIAATQRMAADVRRCYTGPVLALPHHARPGQRRNPIRERLAVVGYQGSPQYIARWGQVLGPLCNRLGARWVPECADLADLDVVVALRDQTGYPASAWKSGVKLANAQATGTPIICPRAAGYEEAGAGVMWADTPVEVEAALEVLASQAVRSTLSAALLAGAPSLAGVAARLAEWLGSERGRW